MTKILRIDRKLFNLEKPPMMSISDILLEKEDALILSAGFEDRVMTALDLAIRSGKSGFSVLLIEYRPYMEENKTEEIIRKCHERGISLNAITYDRQNPAGIGNNILSNLGQSKGRIFVDISGMSKLLIVQILNILGNPPFNFVNTLILYTMADRYPPDEKDVDAEISKMEDDSFYSAMFLSSGVFELTIVPELSSVSSEGQPIRVVAFPSFNPTQLAALRSEIQASYFSLIHGIPPSSENAWRPGKIRILNKTDEISDRNDFEVSTLDYRNTLEILLKIYNEHGVFDRIIIAPTGSKMQTVAVGILRAFLEDIQIIYPTPKSFPNPKKYTKGVKQLYLLNLDSFSDIKKQYG